MSSTNVRFTVDLDPDQYEFLKKYSEEHGITSSIVLRELLFLLETDEDFALKFLEELFKEDKEDKEDKDDKEEKEAK